jgi:hypothetical protein
LKGIPCYFICFVGRLDKDTTEDLCSFLHGIKEVRCRKLDVCVCHLNIRIIS